MCNYPKGNVIIRLHVIQMHLLPRLTAFSFNINSHIVFLLSLTYLHENF